MMNCTTSSRAKSHAVTAPDTPSRAQRLIRTASTVRLALFGEWNVNSAEVTACPALAQRARLVPTQLSGCAPRAGYLAVA